MGNYLARLSTKRILLPTAIISALLLLLTRALELRLPQITRGFWEDEAHHNYPVFASTDLWDLRAKLWSQFQPMLDFFLRKYFWFPLFGHDELSLRIPSLFFSLVTIIAAYCITLRHFRRPGLSPWIAVAFAFFAGAWITQHGVEVGYSAEARHYSLVSLVSLLWCSVALLIPRASERVLALASLLFANTHFFSLPLIIGAYGLRALDSIRMKQWNKLIRLITVLACICVATRYLNEPAFTALMNKPPSGAQVSWTPRLFLDVANAGWGLWQEFISYLGLPVHRYILGITLFIGLFVFDRKRITHLLILLCLVTPAFFIYCRARSSYGFGSRYFSPFFGLGFAVFVLSLESLVGGLTRAAQSLNKCLPETLSALMPLTLSFGLFALVASMAASMARDTWASRDRIRTIPRNFSFYYLAYQEIRATGLPVFLLHDHCWANDIPSLYFEFIGGAYSHPFFIRDAVGCNFTSAQTRKDLQSFLKTYPTGLIVLDQKRQDCSQAKPLQIRSQLNVGRLRSVKECVWTLRNATSLDGVFEVAQAAKFVFEKELFTVPEVRPAKR
ncbi:hypothetical protein WDW86_16710 [Bdellovibrionota bacterium FG-2]